jgi:hypothetical protein
VVNHLAQAHENKQLAKRAGPIRAGRHNSTHHVIMQEPNFCFQRLQSVHSTNFQGRLLRILCCEAVRCALLTFASTPEALLVGFMVRVIKFAPLADAGPAHAALNPERIVTARKSQPNSSLPPVMWELEGLDSGFDEKRQSLEEQLGAVAAPATVVRQALAALFKPSSPQQEQVNWAF